MNPMAHTIHGSFELRHFHIMNKQEPMKVFYLQEESGRFISQCRYVHPLKSVRDKSSENVPCLTDGTVRLLVLGQAYTVNKFSHN